MRMGKKEVGREEYPTSSLGVLLIMEYGFDIDS
jgi:hypothetical protein